ncbi:glycosyltransferase [Pseudonocardia charpentierae]|uniref:Glycosyl transferase family 2 n=1 Tax=Pseudonocardia charpentierae TaxID=3075545 RepID=A0ABU2NBY4_9PSEU|nr:hypothetical protein [Pseudonocardia sp. DSM 45834]MDT0351256.1 hypothetical protein [Pseudonocardia sp. DSM 45834]
MNQRQMLSQSTRSDASPRVALVIAAHNEEQVIADTLRAATAQSYPSTPCW